MSELTSVLTSSEASSVTETAKGGWVSFQNLGITFSTGPVAFSIGSVNVHWNTLIVIAAILVGLLLLERKLDKAKLNRREFYAAFGVASAFGLLGARAVYATLYDLLFIVDNYNAYGQGFHYYSDWPDAEAFANGAEPTFSFWKAINIFDGGLSTLGFLLFFVLALLVFCRLRSRRREKLGQAAALSFGTCLDLVGPPFLVTVAIGVWGRFFEQSGFGAQGSEGMLLGINGNEIESSVTALRSAAIEAMINDTESGGLSQWIVGKVVEPCFLIEFFGCLLTLALFWLLRKQQRFRGEAGMFCGAGYFLFRAITDNRRVDAITTANAKPGVFFSAICLIVIIVLILILRWQSKESKLRGASMYVDKHNNNGFENDTFTKRVYKAKKPQTAPVEAAPKAEKPAPKADDSGFDDAVGDNEDRAGRRVWTAADLDDEKPDGEADGQPQGDRKDER